MKISEQGINLIKHYESCDLQAYRDGGGIITIGYGHTGFIRGRHLLISDKITQAEADALLLDDLVIAQKAVNQLVTVPLTQNQFDALVSFAFNTGVGDKGLKGSTLLHCLNNGSYTAASEEFKKWVRDNKGNIEQGLVKRRNTEKILFLTNKLQF